MRPPHTRFPDESFAREVWNYSAKSTTFGKYFHRNGNRTKNRKNDMKKTVTLNDKTFEVMIPAHEIDRAVAV